MATSAATKPMGFIDITLSSAKRGKVPSFLGLSEQMLYQFEWKDQVNWFRIKTDKWVTSSLRSLDRRIFADVVFAYDWTHGKPWPYIEVFSLTWPASLQIYWNKRKRLHKKRVQLPEDWFLTPTWPPFHCFVTPIWPPVTSCENTLYELNAKV